MAPIRKNAFMSLDNRVTAHRQRTDTSNICDARAERFPRGTKQWDKRKRASWGNEERVGEQMEASDGAADRGAGAAVQRGPRREHLWRLMHRSACQSALHKIPLAGRLCEATEDCQHPPSPVSQPPSHDAANKPAAACFFRESPSHKELRRVFANSASRATIATATEKRDCRSFQRASVCWGALPREGVHVSVHSQIKS